MKKVLMILLAVALILSMTGSVASKELVYTEGNPSTSSGEIVVSLTLNQEYTVIIPEGIELVYGQDVEDSLIISKLVIPANKLLVVSVESINDWNVVSGNNKLTYDMVVSRTGHTAITCDSGKDGSIPIYRAYMDTTNDDATLTFGLTGDVKEMGVYQDTLTFSVSVLERAAATN